MNAYFKMLLKHMRTSNAEGTQALVEKIKELGVERTKPLTDKEIEKMVGTLVTHFIDNVEGGIDADKIRNAAHRAIAMAWHSGATDPVHDLPLIPGIGYNFRKPDLDGINYLTNLDHFHATKYLSSSDPRQAQIANFIREKYLRDGEQWGVGYSDRPIPEALKQFGAEFKDFVDQMGYHAARVIVDTGVMRAKNWGAISALHQHKVTEYTVVGPADKICCPVCLAMNGRTFSVQADYEKMQDILYSNEEHEDLIKAYSMTRFGREETGADTIDKLSSEQIQSSGFAMPPLHPLCRHGISVKPYTVTEHTTVPAPTPEPLVVPEPIPEPPAPKAVRVESDSALGLLSPMLPDDAAPLDEATVLNVFYKHKQAENALGRIFSDFVPDLETRPPGVWAKTMFSDPETDAKWMLKADIRSSGERTAEKGAYFLGELLTGGRTPVFTDKAPEAALAKLKKLGSPLMDRHGKEIVGAEFQRHIDLAELKKTNMKDFVDDPAKWMPRLTKEQTTMLLREKLFDFIIGNNDAHFENFLIKSPRTIVAIDKGCALKDILGGGEMSISNPGSNPSDALLKYIQTTYRSTGALPANVDLKSLLPFIKRAEDLSGVRVGRDTVVDRCFSDVNVSGSLYDNPLLEVNRRLISIRKETEKLLSKVLGNEFSFTPKPKPKQPKPKQLPVETVSPEVCLNLAAIDIHTQRIREQLGMKNADKVQEWLDKNIPNKLIKIRRRPSGFDKMLDAERFKAQYETGSSGGCFNPDLREREEIKMFGDKYTKEKPVIYGFVDPKDKATKTANSYGHIISVLKPEVRNRATFTVGDSLGAGIPPTPVVRPGLASFDYAEAAKDVLGDYKTFDAMAKRHSYIEAQIHGGVSIKDIDYVVVDSMEYMCKSILEKTKALGLRVFSKPSGDRTAIVPLKNLIDVTALSEKPSFQEYYAGSERESRYKYASRWCLRHTDSPSANKAYQKLKDIQQLHYDFEGVLKRGLREASRL